MFRFAQAEVAAAVARRGVRSSPKDGGIRWNNPARQSVERLNRIPLLSGSREHRFLDQGRHAVSVASPLDLRFMYGLLKVVRLRTKAAPVPFPMRLVHADCVER